MWWKNENFHTFNGFLNLKTAWWCKKFILFSTPEQLEKKKNLELTLTQPDWERKIHSQLSREMVARRPCRTFVSGVRRCEVWEFTNVKFSSLFRRELSEFRGVRCFTAHVPSAPIGGNPKRVLRANISVFGSRFRKVPFIISSE